MNETAVNRTKSAINALIDIEQLWIENTPDYNLSPQDLVFLKKRLERAIENLQKIYEENREQMIAAEEEIKRLHSRAKSQ